MNVTQEVSKARGHRFRVRNNRFRRDLKNNIFAERVFGMRNTA